MVEEPGRLALADRPALEPEPGEVVIRPAFCGLCGTDLELREGLVDPAFVRYPLTLGHEWSGIVETVGAGVSGVSAGDRCVAECIIPCGSCGACRAGATNVCTTYAELGFTHEGGASDQVVVPSRLVHVLAAAVPLLDAALVEPASVVMRGLEKAAPEPGQRVLVIGDGTIGLLAAHLAALWSPAEIVMLGRRPEQAELAKTIGATSFSTDDRVAENFDLVIEAAGATAAVALAVQAARRGGRVLLLGLPPSGRMLALPADLLVNNDLTLAASFGYTSAAWSRVVQLLDAGRIQPGRIVTHRFALADYPAAFSALARADGPRGKVMLEITSRPPSR
ncbi:MAG: L-iditol 2-dehydrogenase [Gaiellales bacterium]|nr:L-iditol 2-dehydrogenase [Gaiellales bacterium]